MAIFVALNHCRVVHVAGFGYPSSESQEHPVHYFGNDTMKAMEVGGDFPWEELHTCVCVRVCLNVVLDVFVSGKCT